MGTCYSAQNYLLEPEHRKLSARQRLLRLTYNLTWHFSSEFDHNGDVCRVRIPHPFDWRVEAIILNLQHTGLLHPGHLNKVDIVRTFVDLFHRYMLLPEYFSRLYRVNPSAPLIPFVVYDESKDVKFIASMTEQSRILSTSWCCDVAECFLELGLRFHTDKVFGLSRVEPYEYHQNQDLVHINAADLRIIFDVLQYWPEMQYAVVQLLSYSIINQSTLHRILKDPEFGNDPSQDKVQRRFDLIKFETIIKKMIDDPVINLYFPEILNFIVVDVTKFRIVMACDGPFAKRLHWSTLISQFSKIQYKYTSPQILTMRRELCARIQCVIRNRKLFLSWLARGLVHKCTALLVYDVVSGFLWQPMPSLALS